jgi:hypothetical protein
VTDRQDLVEVARDAYAFFFPMLMGYRYMFGRLLSTDRGNRLRSSECHRR